MENKNLVQRWFLDSSETGKIMQKQVVPYKLISLEKLLQSHTNKERLDGIFGSPHGQVVQSNTQDKIIKEHSNTW